MTTPTKAELQARLTAEQYRVTQKAGTERPFSGRYWDSKDPGVYHCVVCEAELFDSAAKYDSGTGWPSFTRAIAEEQVSEHSDRKFLIKRTEVRCAGCDAHLGHVFKDGPRDSGGRRYCMNSAALVLEERHSSGELSP